MTDEAQAIIEEEGKSLAVDLSDVEEGGNFVALPAGIYPVTLASMEYTMSQRSGNPMWSMQWEVSEGEFAGRMLFSHAVFKPGQLGLVKQLLMRIASDWYAENERFEPEAVADSGVLLGRAARLKTNLRMYEGEKRTNVREVLAPGEGEGGNGGGNAFLS